MAKLLNPIKNYFRSRIESKLIYEDIWLCHTHGVTNAFNNNEYVKKDVVLYDKMIDRYINLHNSRKNNIIKRYDFLFASNVFFSICLASEGLLMKFIDIDTMYSSSNVGIMMGMTIPMTMVYTSGNLLKQSMSSKTVDEYIKMKEIVGENLENDLFIEKN